MNIKESFISVFTNWKNFHGRACRSEYWYFVLSLSLIAFVLGFLEGFLGIFNEEIGYGPFSALFQIITFIPSVSVTSRRLQDRGISGWWQLSYITIIGIFVILILVMLPAKEDENKWGRNPLLDM
tara:strand:+ start:87 stop:461 length:375 start_codon:yes stop_codon:yes gene_type:complete